LVFISHRVQSIAHLEQVVKFILKIIIQCFQGVSAIFKNSFETMLQKDTKKGLTKRGLCKKSLKRFLVILA